MKITCFSDGGARGNPGPAGIGAILYDESGAVLAEISEYLGETTNNQAEYRALRAALLRAAALGAREVEAKLDSELAVKQLNGEYKVKNKELQPLVAEIRVLCQNFAHISFCHVRREQNKEADRLANEAMDKGTGIG